ncbi:unnamed protein product [Mytilus coruscus]|uniref:Uncharacterized protein n=1 Tax=Mytilus coruscus TaxID=42192 RepID=A0A6J8BBS9_MYTCO|nr:unnamed protein product [Mytilus coruscus]
MDNCIFCDKLHENGEPTVKLGKKGCDNINKINSDRQQEILTLPGLTVHHDCRRDYINLKSTRWKVSLDVDQETSTTERDLRSSKSLFKFKENCLFCGQTAKNYKRKRGYDVHMHHHFGSRFLIDTLYNLGFCSSYSEVQRFEMNAAASRSTENENYNQSFVKFIADDVDHNIRSLDGFGTFLGMDIIAASTPGIKTTRYGPRTNPSIKEITALAKDKHQILQRTIQFVQIIEI